MPQIVHRALAGVLTCGCLAAALFAQQSVRGRIRNPHGSLRMSCENCHSVTAWTPLRAKIEFDHNTNTGYPLKGMHQKVACRACHSDLSFSNTSRQCATCHADFHRRQQGAACENCHTVAGWTVNTAAIQQHMNRFPLLGAHSTAACESCHTGGATAVYQGLSTSCISCHARSFEQARDPDHRTAGFTTNCDQCHGFDRWQGARFDHAAFTGFPLSGSHATLDCAACHLGGNFKGTSANCISCHQSDFNGTTDPAHAAAGFPTDCSLCHSTQSWTGARFDHTSFTGFELTGAHTTLACVSCHPAGVFKGVSRQCSGCHMANFEATTNPDHRKAGFATSCDSCHTTVTWSNAKFDHNQSRFPLTGAHASVQCESCHTGGQFTGTPTECFDCHKPDYAGAMSPPHATSGFPTNCAMCHTTTAWQGASFDHNSGTQFPLTGAHVSLQCGQCHLNNVFKGTSTDCAGCHMAQFNDAKNPNHVAAGFPTNCETCHTTVQWQGAKFDHNTATRFPLTGAHVTLQCGQCHVNNVFKGTSTDCAGCHMAQFNDAKNPDHVAAGFPTSCATCHTTVQWQGAKFDHNTATQFPLTGAHVTVLCSQCHVNNVFRGTAKDCIGCHLSDYNGTTNPNHASAGFSTNCSVCHTTIQWKGAVFDHSRTRFPLTGAHLGTDCQQCHVNNRYTGTPLECGACHIADYNQAKNPAHAAAGFPTTCETCHTTSQWQGATFNHNTATQFALTGAHTTVACNQCHVNNVFQGTPTNCVGCHLPDYNAAKNPNHVAAGFPTACETCHTTAQWQGATFNHNTATKFALTGAHTTVACNQCHVNNVFKGTPANCVGCHLPDYNATKSPNHAAAGFSTGCESCHTTATWQSATFNHNTATQFPLTGAHVNVSCQNCHVNNVFKGTTTQCSGCHLVDYQKTTNPNHAAAGFPQDCAVCHNTTQWQGAVFNHNTATAFPLTGQHTTLTCTQCHVNNVFKGTPTACSGCHLSQYNATTNPNHSAAGFPTDCSLCHTTSGWNSATFNHNTATSFPLSGRHTTVACSQCHVNNVFKGTPTACAGCHISQYNSTNNPNHAAAGFPTDCSLCHTTSGWDGASFNHSQTKFPLTGAHTSVTCGQCHVNNQFVGLSTDCVSCHLADYNQTSNPNHSSAGFPQQCNLCHNTTQWQGAVFDHSTTGFPLTGAHTSVQCANCHVGGKYAGTPTDCYSCHRTEYQSVTNPNHVAAGFPKPVRRAIPPPPGAERLSHMPVPHLLRDPQRQVDHL